MWRMICSKFCKQLYKHMHPEFQSLSCSDKKLKSWSPLALKKGSQDCIKDIIQWKIKQDDQNSKYIEFSLNPSILLAKKRQCHLKGENWSKYHPLQDPGVFQMSKSPSLESPGTLPHLYTAALENPACVIIHTQHTCELGLPEQIGWNLEMG